MLSIVGTTIQLTRGDTAYLTIDLLSETGVYEMSASDSLTFTVKKCTSDEEFSFTKKSVGNNTIHIEPKDTRELPTGAYKYDVQLETSKGDIFTVVPVSNFHLMPEVTRR